VIRNPRRWGIIPSVPEYRSDSQVFWVFLQVRAMQRPPAGVRLVVEAVCIMKGIKPNKVAGEKPGTRVDDYWGPGKSLLQDPGKFLDSLFKFDKVRTHTAIHSFIHSVFNSGTGLCSGYGVQIPTERYWV